jgi:hypothetical protein
MPGELLRLRRRCCALIPLSAGADRRQRADARRAMRSPRSAYERQRQQKHQSVWSALRAAAVLAGRPVSPPSLVVAPASRAPERPADSSRATGRTRTRERERERGTAAAASRETLLRGKRADCSRGELTSAAAAAAGRVAAASESRRGKKKKRSPQSIARERIRTDWTAGREESARRQRARGSEPEHGAAAAA